MKGVDANLLLQKIVQHIIRFIAFMYTDHQSVFLFFYYLKYRCVYFGRYSIEPNGKDVFLELFFYTAYRSVEYFLSFIYKNNMIAYFLNLFHAVGAENDAAAFLGQ